MKIGNKAPVILRGRNKEATAIEKSIKAMIKKYGFTMVRFVTNRILEKEVAKRKLEKEIQVRERELEALKRKR